MKDWVDYPKQEDCDDCGETEAIINYHDGAGFIVLVSVGFYCPKCAAQILEQ